MKYLIKFDEQGRRDLTYPLDSTMKPEKVAELQEQGFIIVENEDYQLLLGNVNGKEYVRNTDGTYSEYVPSLDELKAQKLTELKTIRDNEEVKPIAYNGNIYDYDYKARERMRIAQQALSDNNIPNQLWTTYENTQVELTVQDFKNINTLAAKRSGELHIHYNTLKQEVLACTTNEDVEKIEW